jgi:hypothetical protein
MFRTTTMTFLAAGAATLALGVPTALANPWILPPTDVSTAGEDTEQPQVAIAPDGTTTVVWRRNSDGITQAATRPAGSNTFGAVEPLSDAELFSSGPQVAVGPDGETTVVWGRIVGGTLAIEARTRPAGSNTFGAVQTLATNQGSGVSAIPQVAVAPDGQTTVTWVDGTNTIRVATRPAGSSTFGTVVALSAVGGNAGLAGLVVAPDGTTTVVWNLTSACSLGPTCYVVQARTRPAGSNTFGTVQDVSATSEAALSPNLAVAADGATTVAWTLTSGCAPSPCEYTAQTATRPAGSNTFGTVQDVSPIDATNGSAHVAVAPNGETTVVWSQLVGSILTIRARTRSAGSSTFGTAQDISEIGNQSVIRVAAASDGAITVVWEWEDVAMGGDHTVQAASRPAGASAFGTITNLSAAGASPSSSRVAVALNGAITAVWAQSVAGIGRIQAVSSAPTTPPTLELTIDPTRTSLRPGQRLRLRLSVDNSGQQTATNTVLCLRIPVDFSVASATKPYVRRKPNLICWKRGDLAGVGTTMAESKSANVILRVSPSARTRALTLRATVAAKNAANGQPVRGAASAVIKVKA